MFNYDGELTLSFVCLSVMRKSSFKVRKNCDLLRRKKNQPTKDDLHFCSDIEVNACRVGCLILPSI